MAKGTRDSEQTGEVATAQSVTTTVMEAVRNSIETLQTEHSRLIEQRNAVQTAMEAQIAELQAQTQAQIEALDTQITEAQTGLSNLGVNVGTTRRAKNGRRGRPRGSRNATLKASRQPRAPREAGAPSGKRNEHTMPETIQNILDKAGPLSVPDIMIAVRESGYQTKADDKGLRSIIQQALGNHLAEFKRDGTVRTDSDGNPVNGDRPAMFVRLTRGVYGILQKGDTQERVEKRAAQIEKAAEAAAA